MEKNESIKNRSDFGLKAIIYYLENEFNIIYDEEIADKRDNEEILILREIIPPHLYEKIQTTVLESEKNDAKSILEALKQYFQTP